MTQARREAFARQALDRYDRHESMLQPAVAEALGQYVDALAPLVRQAITHAGTMHELTAAAPLGEGPASGLLPGGLGGWLTDHRLNVIAGVVEKFAASPRWRELLGAHVMPVYDRLLGEILGPGLGDGRIAGDLQQWRGQWLEDRTQALLGVPDFVTGLFRTQLRGLAERKGTSVEDAMGMAQKLLDRGYVSWKNRAELIARTEVVGANNQGAHAAWSALSHATGEPATKTWLATPDSRTRKDHKHVDGTTVGIDEDFTVGGHRMNGPGDNRGGPGEVCNCRCTMTYDFPGSEDKPGGPALNSVGGAEHAAEGLQAAAWTWALAVVPEPADAAPALPEGVQHLPGAGGDNTGVALMAGLSAADAARLAVPDGETPEGMHVTVGYLRDPAAQYSPEVLASLLDALAPICSAGLPFTPDAFATAHFNPEDDEREPCAVVLVQSPELATFHDDVAGAIASMASDTFPVWVPHVTVAYNADPSVIPDGVVGGELTFDRLVIGWGPDQYVLGQPAPEVDPEVDTAPEQLTAAAAGEDQAVTAPADTTTPPPAPDEATGGDTAAGDLDLTPHGQQWEGIMAVLDAPSGDGRVIGSAGLRIRPLPLPLSWQRESGEMHDDSVVVGRVLSAEVRQDPELGSVLWGTGDYLDPMFCYDAQQAMAQVEEGLGLCSVDLAVTEVGFADAAGLPVDPSLLTGDEELYEVSMASAFGGVTITSFPSFEQARLRNVPLDLSGKNPSGEVAIMPPAGPATFAAATPEPPTVSDDGSTITLSDGTEVKVGDLVAYPDPDGDSVTEVGAIKAIDVAGGTITATPVPETAPDTGEPVQDPDRTIDIAQLVPAGPPVATEAESLLASSALRPYTAAYFKRAEPDEVTPLTVDPETGEVYGHLATYNECHVGKLEENGTCVTAPKSKTEYSDFHLGQVLTDEGPMQIGKLTVGTGHAKPGGGHYGAVQHYDNSGHAAAVVRASDGKHGIWVCGQVIHDTPASRIEELMRSPLSGDWRMRYFSDGTQNLELCAALAVNVPGFPVRRPELRIGKLGKMGQLSLVAAGVVMPDAGRTLDAIGLPSGAQISKADFESLVAAAAEALAARSTTRPAGGNAVAVRRARARLRLSA